MKKKLTCYNEVSYFLGIIILAIGTVFMEKSDFGVSMVVAPAYLLHLKISETYSFFTFGMAEYTLQAVLLLLMIAVVRKFKVSYLFSFVTAVIYGFVLDGCFILLSWLPKDTVLARVILFIAGVFVCSLGIAFFFRSYISPEVYEMFVKEVASTYGKDINVTKTVYDMISCSVAVVLSFCFFGFGVFRGVKLGTIICAFTNGAIVAVCSRLLDSMFEFKDGAEKLRKLF